MALNQKYTWGDFLRENPEWKKKDVKRTSAEGKKAFQSAYKTKIKEYLKGRSEKIELQKKKANETKKTLTAKVKTYQKAKNFSQARVYQSKIGKQDTWLARLDEQTARLKTLQKSF